MGNIHIIGKIILDSLGINYVIPPINNKTSLEIGSKISPEEMCLPFKIMMGNYIQSIEQGADHILIVGSCGPCRFGEYGELQMRLLNREGYNVKFILVDPNCEFANNTDSRIIGLEGFLNEAGISKSRLLKGLLLGSRCMFLIDKMLEYVNTYSAYEINPGSLKKTYNEGRKLANSENNANQAYEILKNYNKKLAQVPLDINRDVLQIAIIGEIYTIIDPFSNLYIEDKLISQGVSVTRKLNTSWWLKDTIIKPLKLNGIGVKYNSKDYLPYWVGGHGRECVAEAVTAQKKGCDGAIQIFPLGCMPEVVSKAILPNISKNINMPIMSLVVDEMTGEAGFNTRIEAFVDLLERRKELCII